MSHAVVASRSRRSSSREPGLASRRAIVVAMLWLLASSPAAADPALEAPEAVLHQVEDGDTLALLAAEYYGDRRHAVFIATENQLDPEQAVAQPLRRGVRLRIPVNRRVTTAVGDTLASLAEAHLGDPRRARFLAGFNEDRALDLPAAGPLAAGQVLAIPIHVRHRVQPGETLPSLASIYFGAARKAILIREYNFLATEALEPNTELVIPIHRVAVSPGRLPEPDAAARARAERHKAMQARAQSAIAAARAFWRAGDYARVRSTLTELDLDFLFTADAVDAAVLLGGALVALGDEAGAQAAFRKALARAPDHALDAYEMSPKIRAVWEQARAVEPAE